MNVIGLLSTPFRWGSALRRRRVFHPDGVVAEGVDRTAGGGPTRGLPLPSAAIVARLSKAVGRPAALPDVIGLAFRIVPQGDSTRRGLGHFVGLRGLRRCSAGRSGLRPVTSWTGHIDDKPCPAALSGYQLVAAGADHDQDRWRRAYRWTASAINSTTARSRSNSTRPAATSAFLSAGPRDADRVTRSRATTCPSTRCCTPPRVWRFIRDGSPICGHMPMTAAERAARRDHYLCAARS